MKRILAISLIALISLPIACNWVYLQFSKKQLKREIKWRIAEGLEAADLVLIKVSESEAEQILDWKQDDEFEYGGQMYDVVESCTDDKYQYYWCWWDNQETKLEIALSNLLSDYLSSDPAEKENRQKLQPIGKNWICEVLTPHQMVQQSFCKKLFTLQQSAYLEINRIPTTPPPEAV